MDDVRFAARNQRLKEIKSHAVAFLMLGLALFALYTHMLYVAIIPLLWLAFRFGKEQGREEAHQDLEQASSLAKLIQVSGQEDVRAGQARTQTRFR